MANRPGPLSSGSGAPRKWGVAALIRDNPVKLEVVCRDRYKCGLVMASVGGVDRS